MTSKHLLAVLMILAVVVGVVGFSFFGSFQAPAGKFTGEIDLSVKSCKETDYGRDPYVLGEVAITTSGLVGEAKKFIDYCRSSNILVEYYCVTGKLKSSEVECSFYGNEWKCKEGMCVKE